MQEMRGKLPRRRTIPHEPLTSRLFCRAHRGVKTMTVAACTYYILSLHITTPPHAGLANPGAVPATASAAAGRRGGSAELALRTARAAPRAAPPHAASAAEDFPGVGDEAALAPWVAPSAAALRATSSAAGQGYPGEEGTAAPWIFKILHIESVNLAGILQGLKPAHALDTARHWLTSRKPLAEWGLLELAKQQFRMDESRNLTGAISPCLKNAWAELHWELGSPKLQIFNPNLDVGLRVLGPQIRVQLSRALRTSPLAVFRLAYRTVLLLLFSWLNQGLQLLPEGTTRPTAWLPRLLQHISNTLVSSYDAEARAEARWQQRRQQRAAARDARADASGPRWAELWRGAARRRAAPASAARGVMPGYDLRGARTSWRWWTYQPGSARYDPPAAPRPRKQRRRRPTRYANDLLRDPRPAFADAWRVDTTTASPSGGVPALALRGGGGFEREPRPAFAEAWQLDE